MKMRGGKEGKEDAGDGFFGMGAKLKQLKDKAQKLTSLVSKARTEDLVLPDDPSLWKEHQALYLHPSDSEDEEDEDWDAPVKHDALGALTRRLEKERLEREAAADAAEAGALDHSAPTTTPHAAASASTHVSGTRPTVVLPHAVSTGLGSEPGRALSRSAITLPPLSNQVSMDMGSPGTSLSSDMLSGPSDTSIFSPTPFEVRYGRRAPTFGAPSGASGSIVSGSSSALTMGLANASSNSVSLIQALSPSMSPTRLRSSQDVAGRAAAGDAAMQRLAAHNGGNLGARRRYSIGRASEHGSGSFTTSCISPGGAESVERVRHSLQGLRHGSLSASQQSAPDLGAPNSPVGSGGGARPAMHSSGHTLRTFTSSEVYVPGATHRALLPIITCPKPGQGADAGGLQGMVFQSAAASPLSSRTPPADRGSLDGSALLGASVGPIRSHLSTTSQTLGSGLWSTTGMGLDGRSKSMSGGSALDTAAYGVGGGGRRRISMASHVATSAMGGVSQPATQTARAPIAVSDHLAATPALGSFTSAPQPRAAHSRLVNTVLSPAVAHQVGRLAHAQPRPRPKSLPDISECTGMAPAPPATGAPPSMAACGPRKGSVVGYDQIGVAALEAMQRACTGRALQGRDSLAGKAAD